MQSVIGAVKESRGMISGHLFTWDEFNCTILRTIWGPFMQATLRQKRSFAISTNSQEALGRYKTSTRTQLSRATNE